MERKRAVATKISITDALAQLQVPQPDARLERLNIFGTVIQKADEPYPTLILDDGTGTIRVHAFDRPAWFDVLKPGTLIVAIGKPRKYGEEWYLGAEVIRPMTDSRWAEVRRRELHHIRKSPLLQTLDLIRALDTGSGVRTEEIIQKIPQGEQHVNALLEQGEIFRITPDKVKVLE
ncbi:MAG TPA: hypothetical protein VJK52_05885 [Candidatus Nanoarchaeia archaeon]|nr:hypothetical protein [Candidatus Nanoarchaeia archaeon]